MGRVPTRMSGALEGRRITMYVFGDVHRDARVLREAKTLSGSGAVVTIVGIRRETDPAVERREGLTIRRIPVSWRRGSEGARTGASAFLGRLVTLLAWYLRSRRVVGPTDVHHGHDLPGLALAWAHARPNGAPFVYDSHELFLESGFNRELRGPLRSVFSAVEGWLARRASAVITVNESIGDELVRRYRIAAPIVIRNAPPRWHPEWTEPPQLDRFREHLPIPPERPIVLYQGAFHRDRGIQVTVRALEDARLGSAVLVCMGQGEMEGWLREQVGRPELNGRLFLLPPVPPEELLDWTSSADVLVAVYEGSDLNNRLSTPNKLYEGLAAGVPVVTSDFPERARFVAETGVGLLADPSDPDAVAGAIAGLLTLPVEERLALRRRARREHLERFHWEREAERLLASYDRTLA